MEQIVVGEVMLLGQKAGPAVLARVINSWQVMSRIISLKLTHAIVQITKNPQAVMQYINYERDVVLKYGVVLEGWRITPNG